MKTTHSTGPEAGASKDHIGAWGEHAAAHYLESQGCGILDRNWRTRGGEIDIVAFDPHRDAIVAVEVKTRRGNGCGTPEESVTQAKVRRLRGLLIQWVIETRRRASALAVDVVGVSVGRDGTFSLNHVRDVS